MCDYTNRCNLIYILLQKICEGKIKEINKNISFFTSAPFWSKTEVLIKMSNFLIAIEQTYIIICLICLILGV